MPVKYKGTGRKPTRPTSYQLYRRATRTAPARQADPPVRMTRYGYGAGPMPREELTPLQREQERELAYLRTEGTPAAQKKTVAPYRPTYGGTGMGSFARTPEELAYADRMAKMRAWAKETGAYGGTGKYLDSWGYGSAILRTPALPAAQSAPTYGSGGWGGWGDGGGGGYNPRPQQVSTQRRGYYAPRQVYPQTPRTPDWIGSLVSWNVQR